MKVAVRRGYVDGRQQIADAFSDALLGGEIQWWGHRAAFEYELADELAKVSQVVLILNPGDDLDIQTRRAAGLAVNSRILEVPDWGHGFLDLHTADAAALAHAGSYPPESR